MNYHSKANRNFNKNRQERGAKTTWLCEGGLNKEFEDKIKLIGLSTDSIEFLDFLQSSFCQEVLVENKLKIHIESVNIFFNNLDMNESI